MHFSAPIFTIKFLPGLFVHNFVIDALLHARVNIKAFKKIIVWQGSAPIDLYDQLAQISGTVDLARV